MRFCHQEIGYLGPRIEIEISLLPMVERVFKYSLSVVSHAGCFKQSQNIPLFISTLASTQPQGSSQILYLIRLIEEVLLEQ